MRFKSITTRMVVAATLLVALVTIAFSQIFLYQLKQALVEDFNRQSTSLTDNLALNAELGLLLENQEMLEALGANLLKEESVAHIRIMDREKIVVDLQKPSSSQGKLIPFASPVRLTRHDSELEVFLNQNSGSTETVDLGAVEVLFSQERLQHLIKKLHWRIYSFAFIGFLVAVVLAYYLSWITLRSVKRLVQASQGIAAGNWELRVEESGDDEIGQLTRDFNVMAESLVKKRQELEESYQKLARRERLAEIGRFSTIVAHEMKNPLGIIKGALNILAKPGGSPETKETMHRYIDEEVTRLNNLAEEFLHFARPPLPNKEVFELDETLAKAKALAEAGENRGKAVSVSVAACDGNHIVHGDKNLLFQALLNLIENSIDACAECAEITISVSTNDAGTSLSIADNGPGIPEEDREQVFEPFFTRKEKGTGLGLAIVKKIVELHDGRIFLEKNAGQGACFTLWLPKAPGSA